MPRMPDYTSVSNSARIQTRQVAAPAQSAIPGAINRLGATFNEIEDRNIADQNRQLQINENVAAGNLAYKRREIDQTNSLEYAKARTDWNIRRLNEDDQYQLEKNPKSDKWENQYSTNIQKHRDAAAAGISDPKLREKFLLETEDDVASGTIAVRNRSQGIKTDTIRQQGLSSIDDNIALATRPGMKPQEVDRIFTQVRSDIDNMAATGVISPAQAIDYRKRFAKEFAKTKINQDIQDDPGNTYRNLTGGPGDIYYSKLRRQETGGNDAAKPGTSSASGRYQITDGTWAGLIKNHPELGLTVDGRASGEQQEKAIRAITQDNMKALEAGGIKPSEGSLYLAHFLGAQGAINMLKANPGANAAELFPKEAAANENVFFKGPGIPRTVAEVIERQTKGFSNQDGPAPVYYGFLDPTDRMQLEASAHGEWASREKATREANQLEIYKTRTMMENDLSQIAETGKPTELDPQTVITTLGEDDAVKWLEKRRVAAKTFEAVTSLETMSNDDIEKHLAELEPTAGTDSFASEQKIYDAAERRANKLISLRLRDPALSVEQSPIVRQAQAKLDPNKPETVQNLVSARLAAQAEVGIPVGMQQPVPRSEALRLIAPIDNVMAMADAKIIALTGSKGADPSARKASVKGVRMEEEAQLKATIDNIEAVYGEHATSVLSFAISESTKDKLVGGLAAKIFKKIAKGEKPTIDDMTSLEAGKEISVAEKAISGETSAPTPQARPFRGPQPPPPKPPEKQGAFAYPSNRAVQDLLKHPELAPQFDGLYGPGSAAGWLPKE